MIVNRVDEERKKKIKIFQNSIDNYKIYGIITV